MLVRGGLLWLRLIAALAGLAAFFGGVVALFTIDNSAGSLFLITLGTLLVLISLFGRLMQIESFEIMGAKISVHEVVRSRLQLALARSDEPARKAGVLEPGQLLLAISLVLVQARAKIASIDGSEVDSSRRPAMQM